jgi:hypothetical protein
MKKMTLFAIVLGAELLLRQVAAAQGTSYISNLGQPTIGSGRVASDSWLAQPFTTGTNSSGYVLDSVQLLMGAASGSASGFTASIYSSPGNGAPGSSLGSLSGADPRAGGLFSYASNLILSPSTFYFLVVTATTHTAQGAYEWSAADSFGSITVAAGDPWTIPDFYYSSANGSSWTFNPRQNIFQFAINGTSVPEPGVSAMLACGGFCLLWMRRRALWKPATFRPNIATRKSTPKCRVILNKRMHRTPYSRALSVPFWALPTRQRNMLGGP